MSRAPPQQRPYPQQRSYGPPRDQRGGSYDDSYQQGWQQDGYGDYGYEGYDGYDQNGYNDPSYGRPAQHNGYPQGGSYEGQGGYDNGYERPAPNPNWGRKGPPQNYPPQGYPDGRRQMRGPPPRSRDPYGRPPPGPRRGPPPPRDPGYDQVSPIDRGWDNSYNNFQGRRGPQPHPGRSSHDQQRGGPYDQDPRYYQNEPPRRQSHDQYEQNGYNNRQQPPPNQDGRNRAPLPDFTSIKTQQRPGTATGVRSPPPHQPLPPQSQTQPSTPLDGSFPLRSPRPPGDAGPANFSLPSRGVTNDGPQTRPFSDEIGAYGQANAGHGFPQNQRGQEQFAPPARSQTADPTMAGGMQSQFGSPRRQMTDNSFAAGPGPQPNNYNGFGDTQSADRQGSGFNGQPGRPSTATGSRPGAGNVERPDFYQAVGAVGGSAGQGHFPPRSASRQDVSRSQSANRSLAASPLKSDQGSERSANKPFSPPPGQQTGPGAGPPKPPAKGDADVLPHHPTPVRPGLMGSGSGEQPKPAPVRQYTQSDPSGKSKNRKSLPVTHAELDSLRNAVARSPQDMKLQLTLAKKLVEASRVLADEGGRVDQKTKMNNQERYVKEAHKIVKKLAAADYSEAMFYLADCYGEGSLGLAYDPREAFMLYQSAAKLNHAAAAYRTAVCCEIGAEEGGGTKRDPLKALQWYKRAASLGDVPAMYKVGVILLKGLLGQERNLPEAIKYIKKAAERADEENPHAVHELGLLYDSNNGAMPRDEKLAQQYFLQAGRLGYKFSQFKLGQLYEYGQLGCPVDPRNSIIWYTKAAAQGEHQAELALSGWYLTGADGILEHSDTEAYLWARKAATAEPPVPKALFAMGYFTEVGIGCPRSLDEAKRWYGRAAAENFPKARERLEELRKGGSKAQKKRENLQRGNQKQQDENCIVM